MDSVSGNGIRAKATNATKMIAMMMTMAMKCWWRFSGKRRLEDRGHVTC